MTVTTEPQLHEKEERSIVQQKNLSEQEFMDEPINSPPQDLPSDETHQELSASVPHESLHDDEEAPFSEEQKTQDSVIPDAPQPLPQEEPLSQAITEQPEPTSQEAQIDFNFLETESRWLLKVISGPNTGAEFALHGGTAYLIGSDPTQSDVIFQDMSISRKHAKLTIDTKENAILEDLGSKNGTLIDGQKITSYPITGNIMVTMGTTTCIFIDRTQEQKTIFAPKTFHAIVTQPTQSPVETALQEQVTQVAQRQQIPLEQIREAAIPPLQSEVEKAKEKTELDKQTHLSKAMSSLLLLSVVTIIVLFLGIGTTFLFRTEEIQTPSIEQPNEIITKTFAEYPALRFSYNVGNKHLLIVGHVLTEEDQTRMLDRVQQLSFIKTIDDKGVVIDELVWREINQTIAQNPLWRGISITSPQAGQFVVSGFLKTRAQAEEFLEYLGRNFSYMNLIDQKIIIEEDVLSEVSKELTQAGYLGVTPKLNRGELILTGGISKEKKEAFDQLIEKFRLIPGIRAVQSQVTISGQDQAIIDLTSKYKITGYSQQKGNVSVVINGRIVSRGDSLDGMSIINITPTTIFLEHNGVTYKIDYIK